MLLHESSQLQKQLKFWFTLKCYLKKQILKNIKNWTANKNDFSCCGRTSKEAIHHPFNVSDGNKSFQYSCKKGMSGNHKAAGNRALTCFMFTLFWHDFHHLTVILWWPWPTCIFTFKGSWSHSSDYKNKQHFSLCIVNNISIPSRNAHTLIG